MLGAFVTSTPQVGLITVGLEIVGLGWWATDPRATARRLVLGLVAALSIAITTFLYGGQDFDGAAAASLRILVIVLPSAMLTPVIDPSALGDHLAQRLGLPARPVVAAVIGMQRVDAIGTQWTQVQRARGEPAVSASTAAWSDRFTGSARSAFALLVLTMRQTGATSLADARGFAGARVGRTWARGAPWLLGDSIVVVVGVAIAACPWLLR